MARNRNGKKSRGNRTSSSSSRPIQTISLSLSESWDRKLSISKSLSNCHVNDRLIGYIVTSGSTVVQSAVICSKVNAIGTLGQRVFQLSQCFDKWRLNRLLVRMTAINTLDGITNSLPAFGVSDDPINEGPAFTRSNLAELRVARVPTTGIGDSANYEVMWTPVDKTRWYYTATDSATPTAEDLRQCSPCAVVAVDNVSTNTEFSIYYDIVFAGSKNPASAP